MHLLHARIVQERPKAKVIIHPHWPIEELDKIPWSVRLKNELPGYPEFADEERYFLFDEGQTTYWDKDLWLTFKHNIQTNAQSADTGHHAYAILFCSFGNENVSNPEQPTPVHFGEAKVTLDRIPRNDSKPFGLLLDESEFRDVIHRLKPSILLKDDLLDFIYRFTRGHVGAAMAITNFLKKMVMSDEI